MSVICIGEVLWDLFANDRHVGGTSLNVAAHARRAGDDVYLVSAVGDDPLGREMLTRIAELGLNTRCITTVPGVPTGTVDVTLTDGQPDYVINRPAAYDQPSLSATQLQALADSRPSYIYFSTLAQSSARVRETTRRLLQVCPAAMRCYDVNLRKDNDDMDLVAELLADATVVKLNDGELRDIAQALDLPATDVAAFCAALAGRYGLHSVCVTLGADGCALWRDGEIATVPGRPVVVADAVGAGDAFCAILMRGLVAADRPLVQIADRANRLGAYVASHRGAVPAWPLDLIAE